MIDAQNKVDRIFTGIFNQEVWLIEDYKDDIELIKQTVCDKFDVKLTTAETVWFWKWRCNEWDSGWMSIVGGSLEIEEWFGKFINEFKCWWEDDE